MNIVQFNKLMNDSAAASIMTVISIMIAVLWNRTIIQYLRLISNQLPVNDFEKM